MTHYIDPVPRVPPMVFSYRHTSPEYWLKEGGAGRNDYTAADVVECEGIEQGECNAGSWLWLMAAPARWARWIESHRNYLVPISGCGIQDEHVFFTGGNGTQANDTLGFDAEIEARLSLYAELDEVYAEHLRDELAELDEGHVLGGDWTAKLGQSRSHSLAHDHDDVDDWSRTC